MGAFRWDRSHRTSENLYISRLATCECKGLVVWRKNFLTNLIHLQFNGGEDDDYDDDDIHSWKHCNATSPIRVEFHRNPIQNHPKRNDKRETLNEDTDRVDGKRPRGTKWNSHRARWIRKIPQPFSGSIYLLKYHSNHSFDRASASQHRHSTSVFVPPHTHSQSEQRGTVRHSAHSILLHFVLTIFL